MPSREMRRIQRRVGAEKKRALMRKSATKKKSGPKKKRITVSQFLKEVRAEMKKVSWPTRSEVVSYTVVVIITVTISCAFVLFADFAFSRLVKSLLFR